MKRLSKQLLIKSQEAFLLSLEIYNKPTVKYRLESFSFFFINAWELLLKAYILEATKEKNSIFYPKERNKLRKSITLRDALKKVFPDEKDAIRNNIQEIATLRDAATHLIVEELESIYVGLFQAGVLNYMDKLKEFFGVVITDKISPAMLSLIFDTNRVKPYILKKKYGKEIAGFFATKCKEIDNKTSDLKDTRYCISLNYKLALVKNPKNADITLFSGEKGKVTGTVIEVPKDPSLTYTYRQVDCINEILKNIKKGIVFNNYDFQSILYRNFSASLTSSRLHSCF
ncbi:MAG: DUF3644 domain-containing protein [Paludibacteraceae bacterium]|nr:DUF3644 domain-containing protein [Paludibacteraceae bacterium]